MCTNVLPKCLSKLTNIVIGFCYLHKEKHIPIEVTTWRITNGTFANIFEMFLGKLVLAANKLNCFMGDQRFRCHMISI